MKFTTVTIPSSLLVMLFGPSVSSASPIIQRDVYVPHILTPLEGAVWVVGQNQTVTWDVSSPPKSITNKVSRIVLRKGDVTLPVSLADNIDILSGSTTVTVPSVVAGDDYRVVLFGDSGNWSPTFSILPESG